MAVGDFVEAYENAASGVFCAFMGRGVNTYRFLATLVGRGGEVEQDVVDAIGGALDYTIRSVCGRSVPPPPQEGGDCPEPYGVQITYTVKNIDGTTAYTTTQSSDCNFAPFIYGPVGGAFEKDDGVFTGWFVRGFDAEGNQVEAQLTDQVNTAFYSSIGIDSLSFYPCSGEEPICEPRYRLPPPLEFNLDLGPVTFNYDAGGGNFVEISGDLTLLQPSINFDGRISIPFTFNVGPNSLNFSPTFNGDFTVNNGGGGTPPPPVPDAPAPRPPTTIITRPNEDGEEPPPPEPPDNEEQFSPRPESVLYGALVVSEVTSDARLSVITQNENPDIYVPSLGHINFFYRTGNTTGWSEDVKIKNIRQLVVSPEPLQTTSFKATPQPGVNIKVFPVYMSAREFLGLQSSLV